jgi:SAM-dependent methyltransferase
MNDAPGYAASLIERERLAAAFARQIIGTAGPFLPAPSPELDVLDIGCGLGHTAIALGAVCKTVVGIEPSRDLYEKACANALPSNVRFERRGVYELTERDRYDLIVLDNVLEHLPDQADALTRISALLRPAGTLYLLLPNKLWPIEVHYHLPFLSYLPLRLANAYLRASGRGCDYTDASYAPTYWRLKRLLRNAGLSFRFVLPADLTDTVAGAPLHYRVGAAAIRRFPALWAISKAFLVVAMKPR